MDDINIYNKRERHWRMVFKDNYGGVDDAKLLPHAKRWDFYVNEKENPVKGGYLVEFSNHDKKKVIWEVVADHFVEDPTDHEEIGQRGFYFNCFEEDKAGVIIEGPCEFPYLIMLFLFLLLVRSP